MYDFFIFHYFSWWWMSRPKSSNFVLEKRFTYSLSWRTGYRLRQRNQKIRRDHWIKGRRWGIKRRRSWHLLPVIISILLSFTSLTLENTQIDLDCLKKSSNIIVLWRIDWSVWFSYKKNLPPSYISNSTLNVKRVYK